MKRKKIQHLPQIILVTPRITEILTEGYFIGDINLRQFRLSFFNDTLFKINADCGEIIKEAFIIKYGLGSPSYFENESIWVWENATIIAIETKNLKINRPKISITSKREDIVRAIYNSYFIHERLKEAQKTETINQL